MTRAFPTGRGRAVSRWSNLHVLLALSLGVYVLMLWHTVLWTPASEVVHEHPTASEQEQMQLHQRQHVPTAEPANANDADANDANDEAANTNSDTVMRLVTPEPSLSTSPTASSTTAPTTAPPSTPTKVPTKVPATTPLTTPSKAPTTQAPTPTAPSVSPATTPLPSSTEKPPNAHERAMRAIAATKKRFSRVRKQVSVHVQFLSDEEEHPTLELPDGYKTAPDFAQRRFRCLGWRATASCSPDGAREPAKDRSCEQQVPPHSAGYCVLEDEDSGERFRVMKVSCDTMRHGAKLRCGEASDFPNFAIQGAQGLHNATVAARGTRDPLDSSVIRPSTGSPPPLIMPTDVVPDSRGIVLVVYTKLLPSAYATLRTLRRQGCTLPVELWYKPDETAPTNAILLRMISTLGPASLRDISDPEVRGFATKIYAIDHSAFQHVLFLDADNVPVKDPTYLFDLPEYQRTGALFWPDFWHPDHTIFNVHQRSLVWEYLDLPFVDMFEQESGQIVINRGVSERAMVMLRFYAFHKPNLLDQFKIVHGDKDLFRLAWLKVGQAFTMMSHPPSVAGTLRGGMFCGQTMVQHDPSGAVIFLHRNAKKLKGRQVHSKRNTGEDGKISFVVRGTHDNQGNEGEEDARPDVMEVVLVRGATQDPVIWTHLLQFKPTSTRHDYLIDIYRGSNAFPKGQWCYGKESPASPHFNLQLFQDLPFAGLEDEIRAYAIEATDILDEAAAQERFQAKKRAMAAQMGESAVESQPPTEDTAVHEEQPEEKPEEEAEEEPV